MDKKRHIRRAFSAASQSYEQAAVLQREVGNRLVERLVEINKPAARILDLGAGTGTSIRALRQRYLHSEFVALDFALPMLQQLQRQQEPLLSTQVVCADVANLPFGTCLFNLVFSSLTLQWCEDLPTVFREVRRVLADDGLFLFATLGPDTLYELRHSWAAADAAAHVNSFQDMHHVGDALLHAGFADPVVDVERIVLTHSTVDVLLQDLRALGANTVLGGRRVGLTGRRRMQAMREAYEQFRTTDGVLPATFEVVYGLARQPSNHRPMQFVPPNSL